jgi:hypothetical protein
MNPNMTTWPTIACTFGHEQHGTLSIPVRIGDPAHPHGFHDLPEVAPRFARNWIASIYDWRRYRRLEGGYCPGRDAVSETIDLLGIWEPVETALVLDALAAPPGEKIVVDVGSQIGWYTALAASSGYRCLAIEADPENGHLEALTGYRNGWSDLVAARQERVGPDSTPLPARPIRLAKIDVEGAEDSAVAMLAPSLDAGLVDHLLIECSPTFADYYPALLAGLIDRGFAAFTLPDKQTPPPTFANPLAEIARYRIDELPNLDDLVASWHQENVWLTRKDLL